MPQMWTKKGAQSLIQGTSLKHGTNQIKATKVNKVKTPFCFPPRLRLQKSLLQFISLWKQLFTAAHGKYLASE